MPTKFTVIRQQVAFDASAEEIYAWLMDSSRHAQLTGGEATIGSHAGDEYSVHGGYIKGYNLELKPPYLIRQSWRAEEEKWPEGGTTTPKYASIWNL